MSKERDIEILHELVNTPSPSGFERPIAEYIKGIVKEFVDENQVDIDFQNNVIVQIPGRTNKTVLIDAHSDEVAFIISNVDKWGKISMRWIGGGCSTILSARNLRILTEKGIINAIVDRKHSHLIWDEDNENIYVPEDAEVDIGIKDRDKILKEVAIGDPVVFEPGFRHLTNDYYAAHGWDDKSGCFILLKTIEYFSKHKPECNLIFLFSAQEETGTSKIFPVIKKYKPDLVIEADVTFATDYGEEDEMEREVGRCKLGEGLSIYKGVDIFKEGVKLCEDIAKKNKIPYQIQASNGDIGYTSLITTGKNEGIRAMVLGIPIRCMHSPVEVVDYNDLITGSKLLSKFINSKRLGEIL